MGHVYEIENKGVRKAGFQARGGVEVVKPRQTRVLELRHELDDAAINQMKTNGVTISVSDKEAENKPVERPSRPVAAENPAETGGVVPQSSVSEKGGVSRKDGDTTTTTKPTEKQTGAKA